MDYCCKNHCGWFRTCVTCDYTKDECGNLIPTVIGGTYGIMIVVCTGMCVAEQGDGWCLAAKILVLIIFTIRTFSCTRDSAVTAGKVDFGGFVDGAPDATNSTMNATMT